MGWENKLLRLSSISKGLGVIHKQGLVHRDFHSGNVLNDEYYSYITDLGLSRPVNSQKKEGEIYGVLPYIAPEILQGKPYSQASDVYSLGMIIYEVLTSLPPYYDREHDIHLALKICQGLRPQFRIKIPQLLGDLISRCWSADPAHRPSTAELYRTLCSWRKEINIKEIFDNNNAEFIQQIEEAEKYNQTFSGDSKHLKCEVHPRAVYTSRLINTKQITQQLEKLKIKELSYQDSQQINLIIPDSITEMEEVPVAVESSYQSQIEIPPKSRN